MIRHTIERFLPDVVKPGRYIGGELNCIRKDPVAQRIRVCLAFPDVYDIGQSYTGFDILYHILNGRSGTLCERAFAPWIDMEAVMRREGIPLWTVESFLPVGDFDVVGFTLQYELHYTAIVNMLDLAGIPVEAANRTDDDPLVIGGGPNCANPEPVARFFDAFLLGDGEEAFPEMLDVIEEGRRDGIPRTELLRRLTAVEGVYVPSLYRPQAAPDGSFAGMEAPEGVPLPVRARYVTELKPEYYPDRPLVPMCEVVHDRLAVELMRGCARGCRFCGAGMTYRPRRVRPAKDVVAQVVSGIASTGWEEVSLVSLSTSDYEGLGTVVREIGRALKDRHVSISLSSLRADNFSLSMAEAVAGGKKSSLTFAVEAATQRLRDVINKNLTEEQLFATVQTALDGGWNAFKLYFMVGHPTETDEDVIAIADLLNRLGGVLKRHQGRRINVTVSPFCPKPQTPFQWEAQNGRDEIGRKLALIRSNLRTRQVNVREADPDVAMLEGLLGRGGRGVGDVILDAWRRGSRLDGWSELFDAGRWREAFATAGIEFGTGGGVSEPGSPLPWSHLHYGVETPFLVRERERAYRGEQTPDCTVSCGGCGEYAPFCESVRRDLADAAAGFQTRQQSSATEQFGRRRKPVRAAGPAVSILGTRLRVKFSKHGLARYIGHLDLVRIFDRILRRSGIPIAYSQGFHPHPKISFGPPLPLGMTSDAEYVDFQLQEPFPRFEPALRGSMPEGFAVTGLRPIPDGADSLSQIITAAEYHVDAPISDDHVAAIAGMLGSDTIIVTRDKKRATRELDIRPGIRSISVDDGRGGFTMLLGTINQSSVKPAEVLSRIFGEDVPAEVRRVEQYAEMDRGMVTPMDI